MNQPPPVEEEATTKLVSSGHTEGTTATEATKVKMNTLASYNAEVGAGRGTDPAGWCSCFRICKRADKTSLVVEAAGENHSLLPNHLNEQRSSAAG